MTKVIRRIKAEALTPWALRVDACLKRRGVGRRDLATFLGMDEQRLGRRMRGEGELTLAEWRKVAHFCGEPLDALFPEEGMGEEVSSPSYALPLIEPQQIQAFLAGARDDVEYGNDSVLLAVARLLTEAERQQAYCIYLPRSGDSVLMFAPGIGPGMVLVVMPVDFNRPEDRAKVTPLKQYVSHTKAGRLVIHTAMVERSHFRRDEKIVPISSVKGISLPQDMTTVGMIIGRFSWDPV